MKKLALASVMALASISLVPAPTLRAQDTSIALSGPEFNDYQNATTQADPKAKAAALETFLTTYPQTKVKNSVLDALVDAYWQTGDQAKALSACTRLLQVDPNNLKAILYSVIIKKKQGGGATIDAQALDDGAALAQKGLTVPKPAATSADDWKKLTDAAYPVFDSAIALDDAASKKDMKAAEADYTKELMLYTDDQSKSAGLQDSLLLARAYGSPGASQDLIKAIWFYARVWDFAPANYKAQIEPTLEYFYTKYHGTLDGLDAVKTQAATTTFPPASFTISPAPTPAEKIHAILANTPDLSTLALADKELVLTYGSKDDADKLWAVMKDKETPVPGTVIDATASVIKIAVTDDAKQAKTADFIVNMKTPLADKDIPANDSDAKHSAVGLSSKNELEVDGTYDTYTQIPATDTTGQTVQIVLRDGALVPVKKAPVHKPSPAHRPAAH
jgi:hypothetical protein